MNGHTHNIFTCAPHVEDCPCPDLERMSCNPYWVIGACPDVDAQPIGCSVCHGTGEYTFRASTVEVGPCPGTNYPAPSNCPVLSARATPADMTADSDLTARIRDAVANGLAAEEVLRHHSHDAHVRRLNQVSVVTAEVEKAVEPLLNAYRDLVAEAEQIMHDDCSAWDVNLGTDCITYGAVDSGAGCAPCLTRAALARLQAGDTDGK